MAVQSFVPVEKRSKSAQRDYYAQMRRGWNGVNPVSRVIPNKKRYDRKRNKPTYPYACQYMA